MSAGQQYLFDDMRPESDDADFQKELKGWSYTRREVFEKCQRLYYYQYYGATARLAISDQQKPRLRFLKMLSNRHMRVGKIMHWAIRCTLKGREEGREWLLDSLIHFARNKFEDDLAFSRCYKEGTPLSDGISAPALLMEFYYGMADAEQRCRESQARLAQALQNFGTAATYQPFRAGVDGGGAKIESPIAVKLRGVTLRGMVDLAFTHEGRSTVVDWKMSGGEGGEDSLQLLFYAMWAKQEFGSQPEHVDLFKAYLCSGMISRFDFTPKAVMRATARIAQDVDRMRAVDDYGRKGIAEAFTPCGQERVCRGCAFQAVCPKE